MQESQFKGMNSTISKDWNSSNKSDCHNSKVLLSTLNVNPYRPASFHHHRDIYMYSLFDAVGLWFDVLYVILYAFCNWIYARRREIEDEEEGSEQHGLGFDTWNLRIRRMNTRIRMCLVLLHIWWQRSVVVAAFSIGVRCYWE